MNGKDDAATLLVLEGRVTVESAEYDDDGAVTWARGKVHGGDTYTVVITPDGNMCDCPYGEHHPVLGPDSHKHDLALRLAAQVDYQRRMNA